MNETFISFYLRANRVHVFVDALRGLGCPKFICFYLQENGHTLAIAPYKKKDFRSHSVPSDVYTGTGGMEVSSIKLCRIIAGLYYWDLDRSYRIPGTIYPEKKVAIFRLKEAELIDRLETDSPKEEPSELHNQLSSVSLSR